MSFTWSAVSAVGPPVTGDVHGPQSGTTTGPATLRAPMWMCAAVAGPERCLKVSRQVNWVPFSVAVNRPDAPSFVPFGIGFSWPMLSDALSLKVVLGAGFAPAATEAATRAVTAAVIASNASFVRMLFLLVI